MGKLLNLVCSLEFAVWRSRSSELCSPIKKNKNTAIIDLSRHLLLKSDIVFDKVFEAFAPDDEPVYAVFNHNDCGAGHAVIIRSHCVIICAGS